MDTEHRAQPWRWQRRIGDRLASQEQAVVILVPIEVGIVDGIRRDDVDLDAVDQKGSSLGTLGGGDELDGFGVGFEVDGDEIDVVGRPMEGACGADPGRDGQATDECDWRQFRRREHRSSGLEERSVRCREQDQCRVTRHG